MTSDLPDQTSHLLVVCGGRAEDGQLGSGFGFGRLAGVEEGLEEGLQVLSLLEGTRAETLARVDEPRAPDGRRAHLLNQLPWNGLEDLSCEDNAASLSSEPPGQENQAAQEGSGPSYPV